MQFVSSAESLRRHSKCPKINKDPIKMNLFREKVIAMIAEKKLLKQVILLDGESLTIAQVTHVFNEVNIHVDIPKWCLGRVSKNAEYFQQKLNSGLVVYGANTGVGGSADVRCPDTGAVQQAVIRLLNAGFGEVFEPSLPRAVMLIRANCLCKGMSAVRPEIILRLCHMIREDIIPVVPKRGSVSASGDLMPTSYIASALIGRPDSQVIHKNQSKSAKEALNDTGLEPIRFINREGLALVNSCAFASGLSSKVLYHACSSALLTQLCVAMCVEALTALLRNSQMCISELDMHRTDTEGALKQDRYGLRTSAQWLGPVVEMLQNAMKSVEIDLNSSSDNPLVDHINDKVPDPPRRNIGAIEITHYASVEQGHQVIMPNVGKYHQGTALAVAMDTTRQAMQISGKLLFALMSELVNVNLNNLLPPNLSGSDISSDFGFKGMDVAMASYMSELDMLTSPVTRHVLSTDLANQSVNSLALLSARWSEQALTVLQQMLANISIAVTQALDLRWLQNQVNEAIQKLCQDRSISKKTFDQCMPPWYEFAYNPEKTAVYISSMKDTKYPETMTNGFSERMKHLMETMRRGEHVMQLEERLGKGTRWWYRFIRQELGVKFYQGQHYLDTDLQKVLMSIVAGDTDSVLTDAFIDAFE